jgi:hypothetical protein
LVLLLSSRTLPLADEVVAVVRLAIEDGRSEDSVAVDRANCVTAWLVVMSRLARS